MMARPKKWDPCIVTWEDAYAVNADAKNSDLFVREYKPCVRTSIGFFLSRDKDRIFIASTKDSESNETNHDCDDVLVIPLGMIEDVEYL